MYLYSLRVKTDSGVIQQILSIINISNLEAEDETEVVANRKDS